MNVQQQIEDKIKSAMKLACFDALKFSDDESQKIGAEYLLTVNVAKEIATLNHSFGEPCKIFLERQTKLFATDCVPFAKSLG
jgi:hypothetical protein